MAYRLSFLYCNSSSVPAMKTILLTIGFTLGGILSPLAQAQIIPLTIDSTQSSVDISIGSSSSSSRLSGDATFDLQFSDPPSGTAQITDLNLVADDELDFSILLVIGISAPANELTISMVNPGPPGTISDSSFDQLDNSIALDGNLDVSDPLQVAGGNQTIDLSTFDLSPLDFNSLNVTQSGNVVTVSGSFTFVQTETLGGFSIPIEVEATYFASGVVPTSVLLGDVNLDSAVDFSDISSFISLLAAGDFQAEADIDQNEVVDFEDISPFIDLLSSQ